MDRRKFLLALGAGTAAFVAPPRRVYSFFWDNPLIKRVTIADIERTVEALERANADPMLKRAFYEQPLFAALSPERIEELKREGRYAHIQTRHHERDLVRVLEEHAPKTGDGLLVTRWSDVRFFENASGPILDPGQRR